MGIHLFPFLKKIYPRRDAFSSLRISGFPRQDILLQFIYAMAKKGESFRSCPTLPFPLNFVMDYRTKLPDKILILSKEVNARKDRSIYNQRLRLRVWETCKPCPFSASLFHCCCSSSSSSSFYKSVFFFFRFFEASSDIFLSFFSLMDETGQLKQALICSSAGAISGAVSRTVTSPLDVIKIRFQVRLCFVFFFLNLPSLLKSFQNSFFSSICLCDAVSFFIRILKKSFF